MGHCGFIWERGGIEPLTRDKPCHRAYIVALRSFRDIDYMAHGLENASATILPPSLFANSDLGY